MMRRRLLEIGSTVLLLMVVAAVVAGFFRYKTLNDSLSLALDRQELEKVKALIHHGASANTTSPRGNTALIWAAAFPDEELARELLDRGAAIDARNKNGVTALMAAAGWGHVDMVRLLLARGADPDLKDNRDQTALMHARDLLRGLPTRTGPAADARSAATRKRVEAVSRLLAPAGAR
jgi:hypothetical protein